MVLVPLSIGGKNPYRYFSYADGRDKNYVSQDFANTAPCNLLKNGNFAGWSLGDEEIPDCWEMSGTTTEVRRIDDRYIGRYACDIRKTDDDGDISRIYQNVSEIFTTQSAASKQLTFSVYCKTHQIGHRMKPFIYDGKNYIYGRTYQDSGEWEELYVSYTIPSTGVTEVLVGVECKKVLLGGVTYYHKIDAAMLSWGSVRYPWCEHPSDTGLVCTEWAYFRQTPIASFIYDTRGITRFLPFKTMSTFPGVSADYTATITLPKPCYEILAVVLNKYYFTNEFFYTVFVHADNYHRVATDVTSFDITFRQSAGAVLVGAWLVDGICIMLDWDDKRDQYGTYNIQIDVPIFTSCHVSGPVEVDFEVSAAVQDTSTANCAASGHVDEQVTINLNNAASAAIAQANLSEDISASCYVSEP